MPRPIKLRNVSNLPNNCHFGPLDNINSSEEVIYLAVDEFETIRLIDLENMTQEEAAKQMNVARTTVQGIYNEARRKIAEFLVNGKRLRIEGGEYKLCHRGNKNCHNRCRLINNYDELNENNSEVKNMKIAIPVDENNKSSSVCMSYGRTPYFVIYNQDLDEYEFVDNGAAASSGGAGIIASQMLVDKGVSVVITQRLGQNAADVLNAANIMILKSIDGNILDNLEAFKNNELKELTNIHPGFHGHGIN